MMARMLRPDSRNIIVPRATRAGAALLPKRQALYQRSKYGARWTFYDGGVVHTTGRDCPRVIGGEVDPGRCPVCRARTSKDSARWYPSRYEAKHAARLDAQVRVGTIRGWRRSKSILLVDGPTRKDRVRYKPDFDVFMESDPQGGAPDCRIEVKGSPMAMSRDAFVRIRMYCALVREGKQPPLFVLNGDGVEIDV